VLGRDVSSTDLACAGELLALVGGGGHWELQTGHAKQSRRRTHGRKKEDTTGQDAQPRTVLRLASSTREFAVWTHLWSLILHAYLAPGERRMSASVY
jgi:hypothetical protein